MWKLFSGKEYWISCWSGRYKEDIFLIPMELPLVTFEEGGVCNAATGKWMLGFILSGGTSPWWTQCDFQDCFDGLKKTQFKTINCTVFLGGPSGFDFAQVYWTYRWNCRGIQEIPAVFDIIGSGPYQNWKSPSSTIWDWKFVKKLDIKAIVIIGGDDSNTNACVFGRVLPAKKEWCSSDWVSQNYWWGPEKWTDWNFVWFWHRMQGLFWVDREILCVTPILPRNTGILSNWWDARLSHIGLECALQTQPNVLSNLRRGCRKRAKPWKRLLKTWWKLFLTGQPIKKNFWSGINPGRIDRIYPGNEVCW